MLLFLVQYSTHFDVFSDLVIKAYFNADSIEFYGAKCLNYIHLFLVISIPISKRLFIAYIDFNV